MNRRVGRDAVEIPKLKNTAVQGGHDGSIEIRNPAARIHKDQVIELQLVAEAAENNLRSQTGITAVHRACPLTQQIGGKRAVCNQPKDRKSDSAGRGYFWHKCGGHTHLGKVLAFA